MTHQNDFTEDQKAVLRIVITDLENNITRLEPFLRKPVFADECFEQRRRWLLKGRISACREMQAKLSSYLQEDRT